MSGWKFLQKTVELLGSPNDRQKHLGISEHSIQSCDVFKDVFHFCSTHVGECRAERQSLHLQAPPCHGVSISKGDGSEDGSLNVNHGFC